MDVNQTWYLRIRIFFTTLWILFARSLCIYDVRSLFLAEIQAVPLLRFMPSSVIQTLRPLRNAASVTHDHLLGRCGACGLGGRRWPGTNLMLGQECLSVILECYGCNNTKPSPLVRQRNRCFHAILICMHVSFNGSNAMYRASQEFSPFSCLSWCIC